MEKVCMTNAQVALLSAVTWCSGRASAPVRDYREEFLKWLNEKDKEEGNGKTETREC